MAEHRVWAVVPAAGRGARFDASAVGAPPKQYVPLLGRPLLEWTLRALLDEPRIVGVVVALAAGDERWPEVARALGSTRIATALGGAERQDSVLSGLELLLGRAAPGDWVLVHDAARPCLAREDLAALLDALGDAPGDAPAGAMLGAPVVDTVKRERDGCAADTVERAGLWRALTPQVFRLGELAEALREAKRSGLIVTDEAQAMERRGRHARLVRGSPLNVKITRAEDLPVAAGIMESMGRTTMRIGQGFDVHTFGEGDHVMLGGVRIPHGRGVVAHSDGDVVIHALCDAVLGALGEGDIGRHFPDTDPRLRGADSRMFLREVAALMRSAGFALINADVTVLAEAPRIAQHRAAMAENLAEDLGVSPRIINVKATTTERMGFVGRGEGLAASAAVLLGA